MVVAERDGDGSF